MKIEPIFWRQNGVMTSKMIMDLDLFETVQHFAYTSLQSSFYNRGIT